MIAMIAMAIKLLIGAVISYILPSTTIKDIKQADHFRITFIGIISTSIFSVSYQLDSGGLYLLLAGDLIFIGLFCKVFIEEVRSRDRVLFYSLVIIGLFVGFGYIFQGIILSFLVYYITINQSDLFSILIEDDDVVDDDINN